MKLHGIRTFAICLSLLIAVNMLFIPFADTVWAEDGDDGAPNKLDYMVRVPSDAKGAASDDEEYEEGEHVHADPATFQKNFDLSWDQKKQTIQEIEKMVSETITDDMSDLEKYYYLAIAANKRASYDWNFWGGRYFFEYYSHQWDSYGALYEDSVCVGIAIFYSHLCHAAGLPCWFVRTDPDVLDHTICYIPDINGNAYYIDITEDIFFMSEEANPFSAVDREFSHITKACTDDTFNYYYDDTHEYLESSTIKECYKTRELSFEEWFKEYGLHEDTTKDFPTIYVENGSGLHPGEDGYYHASYGDYRSNFVDTTGVWFLDDFYKDTSGELAEDSSAIKTAILNKEFDDQLVNVSGVKKNYDYASQEELEEAIAQDIADNNISVQYFPSSSDGKVVAEVADLQAGTDYEIACTDYDTDNNTAKLTVTGMGAYSGSYEIDVKLNSAVVDEPPVAERGLKYTGKSQRLIKEGKAEGGVMQYALGTEEQPTEEFTDAVPEATDAGEYYVWYKVAGVDGHAGSDPQLLKPRVSIKPIRVNILVEDTVRLSVGNTATIPVRLSNAKVRVKYTFLCDDEDVATVDDNGVVTGVSGGVTTIFIQADLIEDTPNYEINNNEAVSVEVREPMDISETKVRFAQSVFTYNGKVQKPTIKTVKGRKLKAGTDYTVKWSNASSTNAGTYKVIVKGKGNYTGWTDATYTISKAANPISVKAKTVNLKYKSLKKKAKSVKRSKAFTVSKAKGKLSYKLVSAKKGKKSFKRYFKVNKKTGKITVKKKTKKGTYKVKVKVRAKGDANHRASAWKTVTFKVRVK